MTETYCVVAQVSGFATDDDVAKAKAAGGDLDKDEHNEALVSTVLYNIKADAAHTMIRDDGTGEIVIVWKPEAEPDGTQTWMQGRDSIEEVRSAIAGAGLATVNPVKVELRDYEAKSKPKSKTTKKAAAAKS